MRRRYQPRQSRKQQLLLPARIEDYVGEHNSVRAIDAYVDTLDLAGMGFTHTEQGAAAGQPPYDPALMVKIYLYGYCSRIRSSRRLQAEVRRNMEMIWLTGNSRPSHASIAGFRKNNAAALRAVNRDFVSVCRELGLFGGKQVAVDGAFLKASANKTTIHTKDHLDKVLEEIDKKVAEYQRELDRTDELEDREQPADTGSDKDLPGKLEKIKKRQAEKRELREKLEESGDSQISTVDEDARLLTKRGVTVPGYNAQIAVDDKHNLVCGEAVVQDGNDARQLAPMAVEARETLGVEGLEVLADKGYCSGEQLKECEDENITACVAVPDRSGALKKKGRLSRDDFIYEAKEDCYVCPGEKKLVPGKKPVDLNGKRYVRYSSRAVDCAGCGLRGRCLGAKGKMKTLYRWEHEEVVERHVARMKLRESREKMRKRGAMAEHPFGTIKSRNGMHQFLMRGLEKCRGEFGLMVLAYNFTRVLNIVGVEGLMEYCVQRAAKRKEMVGNGERKAVNSPFYPDNSLFSLLNRCFIVRNSFLPS